MAACRDLAEKHMTTTPLADPTVTLWPGPRHYPSMYPNVSEGFLLDEDAALRRHLLGIVVQDDSNQQRPVGVWFSHPDQEIREQRYPYAVISMIDVTEASDRVHAGRVEVMGLPMQVLENAGIYPLFADDGRVYDEKRAAVVIDDLGNSTVLTYREARKRGIQPVPLRFIGDPPIPVSIDYQIRAYSRHPRHSRQIIAQFLGQKVPYRYGYLDMSEIDGSVRRMELLDVSHGEQAEANKRTFINAFTVRVDSWMPTGAFSVEVVGADSPGVVRVVSDLKGWVGKLGIGDPDVEERITVDADVLGGWRDRWLDPEKKAVVRHTTTPSTERHL